MIWIATLLALAPQVPGADASPEFGDIGGTLVDAEGQPVPSALILLCEADSGIPVAKETGRRFTMEGEDGKRAQYDDWWSAPTDDSGAFRFTGVRAGEYRLVAESFPDAQKAGLPLGGALDKHGLSVRLRGEANGVEVKANATTTVRLAPLGEGSFVYNRGSSNDDWYLFLSRGAPAADPVLGPLGWRGPFLTQGIGWVRLKGGETVVHGLPTGKVHYVIFANDSSPCFGAGSFTTRREEAVTHDTNLVGGWSDAIHDPPERLRALTDEVSVLMKDGGNSAIEAVLVKGREEEWNATEHRSGFGRLFDVATMLGPLDRAVQLPSGTTTTVADLLAASAYVRLAETR